MSSSKWEQARAYVEQLRGEGRTDGQIRQIMLKGGWTQEQLKELFAGEVPKAATPPRRPAAAVPTPRRRPRRPAGASRAAIIVVAALAVAAGGAALWRLLPRGPEHTVAQYMAAAEARDEKRVRALLSAKTRKSNDEFVAEMKAMYAAARVPTGEEMEDKWAHYSADMAARLCEKVDRVGVAEIRDNMATVPFTVKGASYNMYFHLIKEDGRWKMASSADCPGR